MPLGIKKLAIFIGTSAGLACTGPRFQVYLRLLGAISVECSDESPCYERVTSLIARNPAKPLRQHLGNYSLYTCYVALAMQFMLFTSIYGRMASGS